MTYFVLYSLCKYVCGSHFIYNGFFQTEKEIVRLLEKGKKIAIDYVCKIHGVSVGVSVTRAMKFRKDYLDNNINKFCGSFAEKDARKLLEKKMNDLRGEFLSDFMQIS